MARQPNAIDFWRGFALVTIFVNHIPGNFYENFTYRNIAMSDSADLFVFLAGWGLRLSIGPSPGETPVLHQIFRLSGRAVTLYAAQMMMVGVAVAMLAFSANYLDNALLLEWHNAGPLFFEPVEAHIGVAILTHQLGYFDILPLYVVLMLLAPGIALVHRLAPNWLLPASFLLYMIALIFQLNLPLWPTKGQWFFNPLCWQLVFVLGFSLARERGPGAFVREHLRLFRIFAVPILLLGLYVVWTGHWPDPTIVPEPKLVFLLSKTFVTPTRLIEFLALVAIASAFFPMIKRAVPSIAAFLSMLGRNSLHVFCAGSLLSLAGQILRFSLGEGILVDTGLVVMGIALLGATGWLTEWRDRIGKKGA